jgi:hypothetical protein
VPLLTQLRGRWRDTRYHNEEKMVIISHLKNENGLKLKKPNHHS